MTQEHNGNVLNERRLGAIEASVSYLTLRHDDLIKRFDKLEILLNDLLRQYRDHITQMDERDPYNTQKRHAEKITKLEEGLRDYIYIGNHVPALEKDVQALKEQARDTATRGSFLKSQWTWLIAGISAGGTAIQLIQRFI